MTNKSRQFSWWGWHCKLPIAAGETVDRWWDFWHEDRINTLLYQWHKIVVLYAMSVKSPIINTEHHSTISLFYQHHWRRVRAWRGLDNSLGAVAPPSFLSPSVASVLVHFSSDDVALFLSSSDIEFSEWGCFVVASCWAISGFTFFILGRKWNVWRCRYRWWDVRYDPAVSCIVVSSFNFALRSSICWNK